MLININSKFLLSAACPLQGLSHEILKNLTKIYRTWPNYGTWLVFEFFKRLDFILQKVSLLRLMLIWVGLIMVSCLFLSVPPITSGVYSNLTGLNVKLLAGCILLFWTSIILLSSLESWHSSCTLHKIFYWESGAPSGIYWCANCRPTWCEQSELCSYWLTQNRRCLWLIAHKTALNWYERLAGRSVTKLIGHVHKLLVWF